MRVMFEGLKGEELLLKIGLKTIDLERLLDPRVMANYTDCGKCGDCGNCNVCICAADEPIVTRPNEKSARK